MAAYATMNRRLEKAPPERLTGIGYTGSFPLALTYLTMLVAAIGVTLVVVLS